jgi:hypothetical protein
MNELRQTKRRIRLLAITGITFIMLSAVFGAGSPARQVHRIQPTVHLSTTTMQQTQSAQQAATASNVLSCPDYDTIYGANYIQLLDSSYTFMSQITTRLPGQNQALLNFQYNAAANQAYSLYTGSMKANTCNPSIAAPTPLSPASPPSTMIDPSSLGTSIPTACAYPLALQYVASYYQQFIQNMQNEQGNFTNFLNNLQPAPGVLSQPLMSGATSVQAQFHNNVQNLNSTFSADISNIGC